MLNGKPESQLGSQLGSTFRQSIGYRCDRYYNFHYIRTKHKDSKTLPVEFYNKSLI